jgi:hypothetical protein
MSANESTQGTTDEASLVASSKAVAAATTRLVAASRAKSDPLSGTQQRLTTAAKAVANATQQLVAAAKVAAEDQERRKEEEKAMEEFAPLTALGQKTQEMEAQIKIIRLQQQLEAAQKDLSRVRKNEYADAGTSQSPAPAAEVPVAARAASAQSKPAPARPAAKPAPKLAPKPTKFLPLAELQKKPPTLDNQILEEYLSDEDFVGLFKMSREEFAKLPVWKRNDVKKSYGLY